ncbi:phage tail tape measure protein [Wolbachia endosymbiont (group A) of Rhinocyllus conicus]|uniref:phage tail tape measure protein n=2 Tax=unclassified Wolbachia TaxID=2640676 RepID=UPI002227920E|nr:phage tail tape measure protein [Wolbachia endosymbiont (group A) of Rhinocyllus conicus]
MSTLSVKIGAILDVSFNSAMAGSSAQLSRLGGTIRQLDASMKSVSKFKELSRNTLVAKRSWKGLEVQVTSLAKQMKTTAKPSKDLKAQFDKAKESAIKAKTAYLQKRDTLHALSEEFKKSGKNIQSLIRDQDKLGASVGRLRSQYSKLNFATKAYQRFSAQRTHFKSQLLETGALALTFGTPFKAAIDFESVMADIRAVKKFSKEKEANDRGFMELGQGIKELSRTIPLSAAELAQITTSGARLGIEEKKDLLEFTETVSKMAVNFGMTAEEVGSAASKLYKIFGTKIEDLKEWGDTINHLSSNTTVEAKDLMAAMTIAGGAAKQFGLNVDQIAGLLNAFISLGKQPKKAAEMISGMLVKLQTAGKQEDEFRETLEEIGIDIEELEESIKENPHKALLDFFEILKKIDKHDRAGILLKLFQQGAEDDIALLLENSKVYEKVLDLLADEGERANSLQEEFNDRVSTTANQLRLLKNSIAEVGMNLGSVMLPILKPIAERLKWVSEHIASFAEKYPTVTTAIMGTIAALISLKVLLVGGGYILSLFMGTAWSLAAKAIAAFSVLSTYAIPAVITGLSVLKATTLSLATSAIPAVTAGVRFLTAAIVSNPIGAIIALLISGAILVISNWGKVKSFFASFWEYIKSIIKPIGEMFSWMGNTVGSIFGKVAENSPLKEFEKRKSIVAEIHTPLKSSISSNLSNNSAIKEMSERSKNNVKIKSVIEEKKSIEDNQNKIDKAFEKSRFEKKELKTYNQTFHQTFNINVKAEPNQGARSIADAVIERFREQARGALFDVVEEIN